MREITINSIFFKQVCTDEEPENIEQWLNTTEPSTAIWKQADEKIMKQYGNGDPNPVDCSEDETKIKKHYIFVVKGWYE